MKTLTMTHFKALKWILRYIKGTVNFGLFYGYSNNLELMDYSDSDSARDIDDRKSTTSFVFYMEDTTFTWSSKKQSIVTLSTCEAEYIATTSCVCNSIWLRRILKELWMPQEKHIEIYVDNSSVIALAKNPVFYDRSKYIDTRFHYLWDCIANKKVEVKYVKTQDKVTDIFIKPLTYDVFIKIRDVLGVIKKLSLGGMLKVN
jgi:hypothetical protein